MCKKLQVGTFVRTLLPCDPNYGTVLTLYQVYILGQVTLIVNIIDTRENCIHYIICTYPYCVMELFMEIIIFFFYLLSYNIL